MTSIEAGNTGNDNDDLVDETEEQESSKFQELMTASVRKIKDTKFIDAKTALMGMVFPLFKALYEELDIDLGDIDERLVNLEEQPDPASVLEAAADTPNLVKDLTEYVLWVGNTFDAAFKVAGWITTKTDDPTVAVFSEKAPKEIRELFVQIGQVNEQMIGKLKLLDEKIIAFEAEADDDDDDDLDGDGDQEVKPVTAQTNDSQTTNDGVEITKSPPADQQETTTEPVKVGA